MREALAAIVATEWFLARVDARVLLLDKKRVSSKIILK